MTERYLRHRLARTDHEGVTVRSAGFVEQNGRRSPDSAIAVAREHGVDLSGHRAQRVTRKMIEESDVIFVMDMWNYHDVKREFGDAAIGYISSNPPTKMAADSRSVTLITAELSGLRPSTAPSPKGSIE